MATWRRQTPAGWRRRRTGDSPVRSWRAGLQTFGCGQILAAATSSMRCHGSMPICSHPSFQPALRLQHGRAGRLGFCSIACCRKQLRRSLSRGAGAAGIGADGGAHAGGFPAFPAELEHSPRVEKSAPLRAARTADGDASASSSLLFSTRPFPALCFAG